MVWAAWAQFSIAPRLEPGLQVIEYHLTTYLVGAEDELYSSRGL